MGISDLPDMNAQPLQDQKLKTYKIYQVHFIIAITQLIIMYTYSTIYRTEILMIKNWKLSVVANTKWFIGASLSKPCTSEKFGMVVMYMKN